MNTIEQIKQQITNLENEIESLKDEITSKELEIDNFEYECSDDDFDDFLDQIYPEINIGSLTFYPSQVLKECDPTAYRCAKSDYESDYDLDECEEYSDLKADLESLQDDLESLESDLEDLQNTLDDLESEDD